ncbi:MAG: amidohydrolase family protein [Candidatus Glassbacteria bacterium]
MVVDAHVHVGRWEDPAYSGRNLSLSETVSELKRSGVKACYFFPTDSKDNETLLSEFKKFDPGKEGFEAYFFPWVDLEKKDFMEFIERERRWISGLKFHPSYAGKPVTDSAYTPFFEFSRENAFPVIIHCGRWREVSGFSFALERARQLPELSFVLSHMGGDMPQLQTAAIRDVVSQKLQNVLFGTESIREYWNLEKGIRELGANRFLFGSDFSLGHPSIYMSVIELCSMTEQEKSLILGKNALRLVTSSRCRCQFG